jgi:hypothetical protein
MADPQVLTASPRRRSRPSSRKIFSLTRSKRLRLAPSVSLSEQLSEELRLSAIRERLGQDRLTVTIEQAAKKTLATRLTTAGRRIRGAIVWNRGRTEGDDQHRRIIIHWFGPSFGKQVAAQSGAHIVDAGDEEVIQGNTVHDSVSWRRLDHTDTHHSNTSTLQ